MKNKRAVDEVSKLFKLDDMRPSEQKELDAVLNLIETGKECSIESDGTNVSVDVDGCVSVSSEEHGENHSEWEETNYDADGKQTGYRKNSTGDDGDGDQTASATQRYYHEGCKWLEIQAFARDSRSGGDYWYGEAEVEVYEELFDIKTLVKLIDELNMGISTIPEDEYDEYEDMDEVLKQQISNVEMFIADEMGDESLALRQFLDV